MGDFSDDDFDHLGEDDLLALEEVCAPPTQPFSHPLTSYAQQTNVSDQNEYRATGRFAPTQSHQPISGLTSVSRPGQTISRSNNDPNNGQLHALKAPPGPSTQREQWRQQRYATTTPGLHRAATVGTTSLPHRDTNPAIPPIRQVEVSGGHRVTNGNDELASELARMQKELAQMKVEQERLKQTAKSAHDQMLAKAGEISILRSNQSRSASEFERRIEDLQKKHMIDIERHQAELDHSKKERERLASHNQFLNHEHNDDNWQLRQSRKLTAREKDSKRINRTTPKKPRPSHFGDGFEDDEVMIVSPAKSVSRSRNNTPKNGLKRKRDALAESPLQQLDLNQSIEYLPDADVALQPIPVGLQTSSSAKYSEGFKFLQQFLNRQISRDESRTYEALAKFAFPSSPKKTLSTILADHIASLSMIQSEDLPSAIGQVILSLWSSCLEENYHPPLRYILDLVQFTFFEGGSMVIENLVDQVVDLAQRTADVNIIPRYKRFKRRAAIDDPDIRPLDTDISTKDCLEMLDLTITVCGRNFELIKRFWKSMRFDFISMLLRNSQDVQDVILMAKILSHSVRADTFAMVVAPPASQSVSEQHVIDRLSAMMIEVPRTLDDEPSPPAVDVAEMRLEILNLIENMCSNRYCGEAFATHPAALGRLVRLMHDELHALYDFRHGHEKRAILVTRSTRLLYHITNEYADAVGNLQEKLRTPPTSVYKHLIVLSRLAFSEGVVFEQDIEEDVIDMAHEMLELLASPEEAEAIQKAFVRESSSRNTTGQNSG